MNAVTDTFIPGDLPNTQVVLEQSAVGVRRMPPADLPAVSAIRDSAARAQSIQVEQLGTFRFRTGGVMVVHRLTDNPGSDAAKSDRTADRRR